MTTIKILSNFKIQIPKDIVELLKLKPEMKVSIFEYNNAIQLIPIGPISKLRGALKGIDTNIHRE